MHGKVACYSDGLLTISTIRVPDAKRDFETSISHPAYNEGHWVAVEEYDTITQARAGHQRWVDKMTEDALPDCLRNVSTARVARFIDFFKGKDWRKHKRRGALIVTK